MNERDDGLTHPGMVSNPKKPVIFGPIQHASNSPWTGEYVGNADLNEKFAVQDNTMSGTFTVKFSLLNGTQLCASEQFSGERISVE